MNVLVKYLVECSSSFGSYCTLFPVLLLDTLNYENIEESCNLTQSTKSLLRILCQVQQPTPLKVKSLNVAVQDDKGMLGA